MLEQRRLEDYMRTIYSLRTEFGCVKSAVLARALHVSKPTVSVAVKRMAADGYLRFDESGFILLTTQGEALARRMIEYNDMFRSLLGLLGMSSAAAEREAHNMEHALSQESFNTLSRLWRLLEEHPELCSKVRSGESNDKNSD